MTQFKDVAIHDGSGECLAIRRDIHPSQVGEWVYKLLAESGLMNTTPETLYQVNVVDHDPDDEAEASEHTYRVRIGFEELVYVERDVWVKAPDAKAAKDFAMDQANWVREGDQDLCGQVQDGYMNMGTVGEPELDE